MQLKISVEANPEPLGMWLALILWGETIKDGKMGKACST